MDHVLKMNWSWIFHLAAVLLTTASAPPVVLENSLYRLTIPLGFPGALMLTTAWVEDTAWNLGGLSPSGGAGPVLQLVQLLAALPAEFTAQTFKEKSGAAVRSKVISGRQSGWRFKATEHNRTRHTLIL